MVRGHGGLRVSMEGAAQDSPSGRQRAAIPEGGTHLPDQGSKTRDKVLHCVAAALVPPAPGGSWGPAGLRQRPQRRGASGRGEGRAASRPYLLPFLAVYLFPLWFVLGWNWPWCSRESSWEICCKAGKAC